MKDSDRIQPEWFSPNWDNLKANNDSKHVIQKNNTSNLRVYLLKCRKINVESSRVEYSSLSYFSRNNGIRKPQEY